MTEIEAGTVIRYKNVGTAEVIGRHSEYPGPKWLDYRIRPISGSWTKAQKRRVTERGYLVVWL